VEVYIRRELMGWLTVEEHDKWKVVRSGEESEEEGRTMIAKVYFKRNRTA